MDAHISIEGAPSALFGLKSGAKQGYVVVPDLLGITSSSP